MERHAKSAGRLVVAQQSSGLRNALWELVSEAKAGDMLAPVTVVGPTGYANLSLRHELGRNGFANVRFILLPVLAELLGAASLASKGYRPLTGVLERVFMRAVLMEADGPLAPVRGHASTQASLRASFQELRYAPDSVLDGLERQGGARAEVVSLYRRFGGMISAD